MDFEGVKKYIKSFISYEDVITFKYEDEVFDLDRVRDFVDQFKIDFSDLKFVHVAGSKGKGTTSSLRISLLGTFKSTGRSVTKRLAQLSQRKTGIKDSSKR